MKKHAHTRNALEGAALEGALISVYSLFVLLAYCFFLFSPARYAALVAEDGLVENFTALLLFASALLCGHKVLQAFSSKAVIFYFTACLALMFGTGEELSWGQRIFQFSTPDGIKSLNTQGEFNVHNLEIGGIRWNKVLFGIGLYGGAFCYFLLFPFLLQAHAGFRRLAFNYQIPIPKWRYSLLYLLSFLFVLLIPRGHHAWELEELLLSGYLFLTFLQPQKTFHPSGSPTTTVTATPTEEMPTRINNTILVKRSRRSPYRNLPHS